MHLENDTHPEEQTEQLTVPLGREESAAARVVDVEFPIARRGYDRNAVDAHLDRIARLVDSLEATQSREGVIRRALDDIGEETSAVLKRAHQAAEEIAARSRSQAEGRLERARLEADAIVREAEERKERLERDTLATWRDRERLLEELRIFADAVLGVADEAAERIAPPDEAVEQSPPVPAAVAPPEDGLEPEPTGPIMAAEAELEESSAPPVDEAADEAALDGRPKSTGKGRR